MCQSNDLEVARQTEQAALIARMEAELRRLRIENRTTIMDAANSDRAAEDRLAICRSQAVTIIELTEKLETLRASISHHPSVYGCA